jgi:hypothetical protein
MSFESIRNWVGKPKREAAPAHAEVTPAMEIAFSSAVGDVKRNLEFAAPGISEDTKARVLEAVDALDPQSCADRLSGAQPHEALYSSDSTLKNVQQYVFGNVAAAIDKLDAPAAERDALFAFVQTLD